LAFSSFFTQGTTSPGRHALAKLFFRIAQPGSGLNMRFLRGIAGVAA
jgi:hypothetical protein